MPPVCFIIVIWVWGCTVLIASHFEQIDGRALLDFIRDFDSRHYRVP